jgi:transposase
MCDSNPIELAWAKIGRNVRENNVTGDLSLKKLL